MTHAAGLFLDERIEDLEKVNRVNFMGVIYTLKAGLPGMVARGSGRVLMMSSMMAMYGESPPPPFFTPHPTPTSTPNLVQCLGKGPHNAPHNGHVR